MSKRNVLLDHWNKTRKYVAAKAPVVGNYLGNALYDNANKLQNYVAENAPLVGNAMYDNANRLQQYVVPAVKNAIVDQTTNLKHSAVAALDNYKLQQANAKVLMCASECTDKRVHSYVTDILESTARMLQHVVTKLKPPRSVRSPRSLSVRSRSVRSPRSLSVLHPFTLQ